MAKTKPTFPARPCPNCGVPIHIKSKQHEACGWRKTDMADDHVTAPATRTAAQQNGETTGSYFRRVFRENPRWLKGRSNQEVLDRWLADHPEHAEVPKNVKAHLSNVKSTMRSRKRRKGAERAEQASSTMPGQPAAVPVRRALSSNKLEELELQIDECLTAARHLDKEGLHEVIQLLRRARNAVVWKMGQ